MESRYYKPKIEEFCVGFEFEHTGIGLMEKWNKLTCSINRPFGLKTIHILEGEINHFRIRVKILDRGDIEAEGWKFVKAGVDHFELDGFKLFFFDGNPVISIHKTINPSSNFIESPQVFRGMIRNRTEFKKLLKQLGVQTSFLLRKWPQTTNRQNQ